VDDVGELNRLSATAAARKLAAREITAVELVSDCLERIAEREPTVHAWAHVDADAALKRARALDAGSSTGLLHGLPIGVKDLLDTCDMPTSYGSPIYADHRPVADASSVALARAAGAVVVGKTVTTEFATFHPGPTCNPRNPLHTPGGSSSGSGAAVADWMVPLAFGSQTAGSIIRPAAFCGVVGYKPTYGTINRVGAKMISDTLDTLGVLARTVADAGLFAAALSARRELVIDETIANAPPRFALCRTYEWNRAHAETMAAFEEAGRRLSTAGASVRDVALPEPFAELAEAQASIMVSEVAKCLSHEWLVHREDLSNEMITMIEAGLAVTPERYDAAQSLARTGRRLLPQVFSECDVLIAPSAIGEAPIGIHATGDPLFNRIWTLLRTPCVHVPCTLGSQRLPLGVTVVGPIHADRLTLLAANWVQSKIGLTDN
jgi:Asp-tRNA(Asn)/Glu-tRNA(Gln) amidotransferase A subunit family amidase